MALNSVCAKKRLQAVDGHDDVKGFAIDVIVLHPGRRVWVSGEVVIDRLLGPPVAQTMKAASTAAPWRSCVFVRFISSV